ncbi:MAG: fibronectin type III domain-containing protein [Ignavibacteria bacterium]|nr:fibronectin type III domain-containing protein [Ignavibacteria bacterium]
MVQSVSASSIRYKWTPPANTTNVTGYVLMAIEKVAGGTGAKREVIVSGAGSTTGVVGGLTEGKIYECMVHALNDTVRSDASNEIEWAPAQRGTGSYKLYSSNNAAEGSGLGIFRTGGPAVLKIANGGEWDICFDDKFNPADPRIGSPGQSAYVDNSYMFPNGQAAKIIYAGRTYTGINSLDEIYETSALDTSPTPTKGENCLNSAQLVETTGWGYAFAWKDESTSPVSYWYGKLIAKRTGGTFVQGTGSGAYVEVDVSYQNVKDLPYAVKQRIENHLRLETGRRATQAR